MAAETFQSIVFQEDGTPKYRQLADWFELQIRDGSLSAGSRISSERDLARLTGVSVITVSGAMNELMSRGLVERKVGSGTFVTEGGRPKFRRVGFFHHGRISPGSYYMGTMLETLFDFWSGLDTDLIALSRQSREYRATIDAYALDGVMICSPLPEFAADILELHRKNFPVIVLSSIVAELEEFGFGYSNSQVMDSAVRYLAGLGHRNIALLLPHHHEAAYRGRYEGFMSAMWKEQLPINPAWTRPVEAEPEMIRKLLSAPNRPGAVICGSCSHVQEVYSVARELGIRIPQDLSVLSIDEDRVTRKLVPEPSCFRVDVRQLSREGAEAMNLLLEKKPFKRSEQPNFEFIDRNTCSIPTKP